MKTSYPIVITNSGEKYLTVYIPDFDINTEGKNYEDAIEMAKDAISMAGLVYRDKGLPLPTPSIIADIASENGDVVTSVDVDFADNEMKHG